MRRFGPGTIDQCDYEEARDTVSSRSSSARPRPSFSSDQLLEEDEEHRGRTGISGNAPGAQYDSSASNDYLTGVSARFTLNEPSTHQTGPDLILPDLIQRPQYSALLYGELQSRVSEFSAMDFTQAVLLVNVDPFPLHPSCEIAQFLGSSRKFTCRTDVRPADNVAELPTADPSHGFFADISPIHMVLFHTLFHYCSGTVHFLRRPPPCTCDAGVHNACIAAIYPVLREKVSDNSDEAIFSLTLVLAYEVRILGFCKSS